MLEYGISKSDLKEINRAQVMRTIWEFGPISRADIASRLCITRAAITLITNEMIADGLLVEIGKSNVYDEYSSSKGRRKILLDISTDTCFQMGIYIDRYNVSVGLANINGDILEKENFSIMNDISSYELAEAAEAAIRRILQNSCLKEKQITGIGIGLMPDMPDCILKDAENDRQYFDKLQKAFYERMGIPVFVGDALSQFSAFCWGQHKRTCKQNKSVFLYSDDENIYLNSILNMPSVFEKLTDTVNINSLYINSQGIAGTELTRTGICRKATGIYSKSKTPALYKITAGDIRGVSIARIMTAVSLGDEPLKVLREELLDELCILMNNAVVISGANNIYFYKFDFTKQQLNELREHYKCKFGSAVCTELNICDITDDHRFICGCFYAVLRGMFKIM
ncbi:MAG: MarR family transcriptional regulator [Ruminococcus sp.]|nr:MarR family transcriptional regulator [Ruminococcus sp.]